MSDFYQYFKENMESLGLPAPASSFGTLQTAVGSAAAIVGHIDKFGTRVTIRELIGAGTRLEGLAVVASCTAAFYVGAVIGSIAVATGRSLAGGTSLSDVLFAARLHRVDRPWLVFILRRRPGIYDVRAPARSSYRNLGHI